MSFIKEKFIDNLNDDILFLLDIWSLRKFPINYSLLQGKWAGNEHLKLEIIHVC